MTLLLNGTNGVSDVDGSASTPAIRGTDTNTGIFFPAADTIAFAEGGAEVARFDSSGNLGLGTSSPSGKLHVAGLIRLSTNPSDPTDPSASLYDASFIGPTLSGNSISFRTSASTPVERMRIDSSGNVLINQTATSAGADGRFSVTAPVGSGLPAATFKNDAGAGQYTAIAYNAATTGNNQFILFGTETSFAARGGISYNRGAGQVAYNTTSDQRLKENITDASSALPKVNSISIKSFDWKETGNHVDFGVIAQELITVAPECVTEGIDNEDGSIKSPWQVDTAALVPVLVKAIQEQQAIITDLKSRIEALEQA
jgi:hypothetical protein